MNLRLVDAKAMTNPKATISEVERDAVREQLERILEFPAFRNSQRSARFLRYVVEYWLNEDHGNDPLKERTLGVELFGFDPTYDTNQYTAVRNAASDVRRRIALYYSEPGHEDEIQIEIPAGTYMPCVHFSSPAPRRLNALSAEFATLPDVASLNPEIPAPQKQAKKYWSRDRIVFALIAAGVVIAAVLVFAWVAIPSSEGGLAGLWKNREMAASSLINQSDMNRFWKPILEDLPFEPVILICVDQLPAQSGYGQDVMPIGDAMAVADFARLLGLKDVRFHIAMANQVSANDIQAATVLMVGGAENRWNSYVTDGLRFHLVTQANPDGKDSAWIEDRKNPSRRDWVLAPAKPGPGAEKDYAIVGRVFDQKTGRWRVISAGLGGVGTATAARMLVDSNYLKELTDHLPPQWKTKKNVEAVISVQLVNGEAGFPQVVAYEIW